MKWLIYFWCILLALSCGIITSYGDGWRVIPICDTGTGMVNGYPSLDLDSHDYPHFSFTYCDYYEDYPYYDDYNHKIKYGHWTGSSWEIQTIAGKSQTTDEDRMPYLYLYSSLDVDSQDNPHIMYSNINGNDLMYAHWDGSYWQIENVYEFTTFCPDIELDSQDYAHCVYVDRYWSQNLRGIHNNLPDTGHYMYTHWTGSDWEFSELDHQEGFYAWGDIHLVVDSLDQPYAVWCGCNTWDLRCAKWDGTTWDIQIIDPSGNVNYFLSIALDSQEQLHIVYNEKVNDFSYNLKYAYWTGSEWNIQTLDVSGYVPMWNSIAIDSQDRLHIAYVKKTQMTPPYDYYYLKYASWTGSEWETETIRSGTHNIPSLSFKLDSQDGPHILFHDSPEHEIYYAWQGEGLAISLLSFTATPQEDSSILLNWQVESTEGEQIAGFNLYRREINNDVAAEVSNLGCIWTKINSSLITGQNPYAYTDSTLEPGKSYEYRLEAVLADESAQTLGTCQATTEQSISFAITKVYPNPASDVLNIALTLPQAGEVTLELYDLTGRVVFSKDIQAASAGELTYQLDVSGLANGVYTLQASQVGLSASERVVVVR